MDDATPTAGDGFGARMTRRVGPLPAWTWAAIALAVYVLHVRLSRSAAPVQRRESTPSVGIAVLALGLIRVARNPHLAVATVAELDELAALAVSVLDSRLRNDAGRRWTAAERGSFLRKIPCAPVDLRGKQDVTHACNR